MSAARPDHLQPDRKVADHGRLKSKAGKLVFLALLLCLSFAFSADTGQIARQTISDAFVTVSSFVALTLAIFYLLEHGLKLDTAALLHRYQRYHIPIAAFMGALPGCGGAIMVMTQYVTGRLGFGSVVAVLTSTMGDAAFLLIAQEPKTAALVYVISLIVGTVSGYVVEAIHGQDFLRRDAQAENSLVGDVCDVPDAPSRWRYIWMVLICVAVALGIGNAFQLDTDLWFGALGVYQPTLWLGFSGALVAVLMWAVADNSGPSVTNLSYGVLCGEGGLRGVLNRTAMDTNFVTVWVIAAFLMFELTMHWTQFDFTSVFRSWGALLPLIAVLVGFLPGCGPQILVTTFYLQGLIPFSAQLANAISNDGDALFPAIAMAPRAAILATVYTAIPALIIGYSWYFMGG